MNTEDQSPKFSLFHRESLQSRDIIQKRKQASCTVTKANRSSRQWIREVALQLKSPFQLVTVSAVYVLQGRYTKYPMPLKRHILKKKMFLKKQNPKKPSHAQVTPSWKLAKGQRHSQHDKQAIEQLAAILCFRNSLPSTSQTSTLACAATVPTPHLGQPTTPGILSAKNINKPTLPAQWPESDHQGGLTPDKQS